MPSGICAEKWYRRAGGTGPDCPPGSARRIALMCVNPARETPAWMPGTAGDDAVRRSAVATFRRCHEYSSGPSAVAGPIECWPRVYRRPPDLTRVSSTCGVDSRTPGHPPHGQPFHKRYFRFVTLQMPPGTRGTCMIGNAEILFATFGVSGIGLAMVRRANPTPVISRPNWFRVWAASDRPKMRPVAASFHRKI